MLKKTNLLMVGFIVILVLVIGCAKPPQNLVDLANTAMNAAKEAEADRYLADEFQAAQDTLNAALAEIEVQKSKFALKRNYDQAAELLQFATDEFNLVKDKVGARKEEVKAETEQMILDLQKGLADAKNLLKKAPKGKEGREALEAIKADLSAVETSLTEVTAFMDSGDYISAYDKVKAGTDKVNSIIEELKQAIAKRYGK